MLSIIQRKTEVLWVNNKNLESTCFILGVLLSRSNIWSMTKEWVWVRQVKIVVRWSNNMCTASRTGKFEEPKGEIIFEGEWYKIIQNLVYSIYSSKCLCSIRVCVFGVFCQSAFAYFKHTHRCMLTHTLRELKAFVLLTALAPFICLPPPHLSLTHAHTHPCSMSIGALF